MKSSTGTISIRPMRDINNNITNYYVIPVKASGQDDSDLETCYYFDEQWKHVSSKSLKDTKLQNLVCIRQRLLHHLSDDVKARLLGFVQTNGYEINTSARLLSANAKTLAVNCGLNNLFLAVEETIGQVDSANAWSVTIPVAPGTRRGVILVFRLLDDEGTGSIIATSDPEVESGSSN